MRPRVAIVGAGRAGSALAVALCDAGYPVTAVQSRTPARAVTLAGAVGATVTETAVDTVRRADVVLLTVPDAQIVRVAATVAATGMATNGKVIAHSCATLGTEVLAALRVTGAAVGTMHPLQSLSGPASAARLRGSLFAVDGDPLAVTTLTGIAEALGGVVTRIPAEHRAAYHAAATLAGNAPLALLAHAVALLEDAGVAPADAVRGLARLMAGAAANAEQAGDLGAALTGPVARGDAETVTQHLDALDEGDPATAELYRYMVRELVGLAGPAGREPILDAVAHGTPRTHRRGRPAA